MVNASIAKTFEMRGICLPLTTECLRHSRLRVNERLKWEILLTSLAGDKGAYVIPWDSVPRLLMLSLHDRVLIKKMNEDPLLSPGIVRQYNLNVNHLGYDGADPMVAAGEVKAEVPVLHSILRWQLMTQFCASVEGLKQMEIKSSDLAGTQGQERLQKAFISFAQTHKIAAADVAEYIDQWVDKILCCGFKEEGQQGHLLKILYALNQVAEELSDWMGEETSGSAAKTKHVIDALLSTHSLGMDIYEKTLKYFNDIGQSLSNWEVTKTSLDKCLFELSHILDGWDEMLQIWDESKKAHRHKKRLSVHTIMQFMPILPKEILNPTQIKVWAKLGQEQLTWRTFGDDSRPIQFDQELIDQTIKFSKYPCVDYA